MAFDTIERSNYDAVPVALYKFSLGVKNWFFTSQDSDLVYSGSTYISTAISDNGSTQSGNPQNDDFTVTMPALNPVAQLFVGTPPVLELFLTVRRKNRGDAEAPVVWIGTVSNVKQTKAGTAEAICKLLTATLNRNGLRLAWGRGCPHSLYDTGCKLDPEAFATLVQIEAISAGVIQSAGIGLVPRNLSSGYLQWEIFPGVMERRPIESHSGTGFTVLGLIDGLSVGMWIKVYPGCTRVVTYCNDIFSNLVNYGGYPHLPGKSPFDGNPVF